MPRPLLFGFVDLALLSALLFRIAAQESQVGIETMQLPTIHGATVGTVADLGTDLQILNLRLPEEEGEFHRVHWNGQSLYPYSPSWKPHHGMRTVCPDLYWEVYQAARSWPQGAPVLIRADRLLPFQRISRVFGVFSREGLRGHPLHLALTIPR